MIIRLIIFIFLVYILYRVTKNLFGSKEKIRQKTTDGIIDEMVLDPACGTYIPRRDAIRQVVDGKEIFFCSDECASTYKK